MKNVYYKLTPPVEYKASELQIFWDFMLALTLMLNLDFHRTMNHVFIIDINIFELFKLHIFKTEKEDHAGTTLCIKLICIELYWEWYDTRHWNYDNDTWEVYK